MTGCVNCKARSLPLNSFGLTQMEWTPRFQIDFWIGRAFQVLKLLRESPLGCV